MWVPGSVIRLYVDIPWIIIIIVEIIDVQGDLTGTATRTITLVITGDMLSTSIRTHIQDESASIFQSSVSEGVDTFQILE